MSIVPAGKKIACRVNVPAEMAAKARYALEALLVPLGLEAEWSGAPRIVYGTESMRKEGTVHLPSSEDAIAYFSRCAPFDASPGEMRVDGEQWPIPFMASGGRPDLVASTFLFLSGWHEAASDIRDEHGRIPFEATLPGVLGIPERPAVDAYREVLRGMLAAAGIEPAPRAWDGRAWALAPTHDIDYLKKWRAGILFREFLKYPIGNPLRVTMPRRLARLRDVAGQLVKGDPYRRALARMINEVENRGGAATYFIKAGAGDPHDVPYAVSGRFLQERLAELREREFEVALHPSYRAIDDRERLRRERDLLAGAASTNLTSVRQHYLRYDPLATPRLHAGLGFAIDSTLGFADRVGFRRGTCLPYRLYDLENDRSLHIWEMPLAIMESALFIRQELTTDEARARTESLMATCRRYGGICVALWHNTLWDEVDFPGWGEHFTCTLDHAVQNGALIASLSGALRSWR